MHETLLKYPDLTEVESLGAVLAQARSARGWGQREVASRLSLDPAIIEALEGDAFHKLGAPVFVRSYIVRYARLLGLPEQELVERYRHLAPSEPPPLRVGRSAKPQARMSDTGVRWFSYSLLLALIVTLGALGLDQLSRFLDGSSDRLAVSDGAITLPPPALPPRPTTVAAGTSPAGAAPAMPAPSAGERPSPPLVGSAPPPDEPAGTTTVAGPASIRVATDPAAAVPQLETAYTSEELTAAAEVAPAEATEPPPPSGPARLVLKFSEDCWVDIKDAGGERLAYGTMKANTTRTLTGTAPFRITLGNAVGVSIELDGKTVDRAVYVPKRGTVNKFVLGESSSDA